MISDEGQLLVHSRHPCVKLSKALIQQLSLLPEAHLKRLLGIFDERIHISRHAADHANVVPNAAETPPKLVMTVERRRGHFLPDPRRPAMAEYAALEKGGPHFISQPRPISPPMACWWSRAQIEKDRMRTEVTGANGEKQVIIFDGVKQVLTTINLDRKTYTVVTKADMDARRTQQAGAQARQEEARAKTTPAQRAQMEALMRGRATCAPGSAAAALEALGYVGIPIKRIEYSNGQPRFSFELVQATRQSFPASSYEVRAGFQKQASPMEAMGRGRGR